jgi:diguanylate cyclase (GGDEF)-like protein
MIRLSFALNSSLGSGLIFILIFVDYIRKYNTDSFQRKLFLNVLIFAFISLIANAFFSALDGYSGRKVYYFLNGLLILYYVFQPASFYYVFLLFDYLAFKNKDRTRFITRVVWAIFVLHGLVLALNVPLGFYFYLSENNVFHRGNLFFIRLAVSYAPVLFFLADLIPSFRTLRHSQIYLVILLFLLAGTGSVIDLILGTRSLIWPCFSSALLYFYFFIIKTDSKMDTLTGIGNRYSFNEFIDNLSRQSAKASAQSYAIVMIDMDHFKQINDTLGHLEGDNALRDMAAIIKGCVRHTDFAARYGGDEFVLAARAENDITKLMERLQQAIDLQNGKKTRPYKIEISYGYDVFTPNGDQSIEKFLAHIDSLMYQHKAERRRKEDLLKESDHVR